MLLSLPAKIMAAHNMPWDIDIVPVVQRNVQYVFPPVGTLSSVAAYNLPMLQWLHLPAQWLTGNVWWTIFLTLVIFNALGTAAVYALAHDVYDDVRAASVATVLFTFSEVGISSAYTAWAQLLLPSYFALTMLCLWWWYARQQGWWLALAGILATAAFMTHFSAVLLYPAMLIFALLVRARWQWGWLLAGIFCVIVMLLPYTLVQIERDFVDARAFAVQEPLVSQAALAEVQQYKPENQNRPPNTAPNDTTDIAPPDTQIRISDAPRPRWLRALDYAVQAPQWYLRAMTTAFDFNTRGVASINPTLGATTTLFLQASQLVYGVSIAFAIWQALREWRTGKQSLHDVLVTTPAGRVLVLIVFLTVMIALMIATRTITNTTYWMGFASLQWVIAAYGVSLLPRKRAYLIAIVSTLILYAGVQSADRILRVTEHDDTAFSAYNISLYRHVANTVDYIAADWSAENDATTLTISYDILPDVPHFWWVPAWYTIDESYRIGMNFDFLLSFHYGLDNANRDPVGMLAAGEADYIVIYSPSLERYDTDEYDITRFGAIIVLQPR